MYCGSCSMEGQLDVVCFGTTASQQLIDGGDDGRRQVKHEKRMGNGWRSVRRSGSRAMKN